MSEVEKMYKNVRLHKCTNIGNFCKFIGATCERCEKHKYPPFTAEKQLKLIELFISSIWWENLKILYKTLDCSLNFEDKLAKMVNYLWLSLSEEEKRQVKGILE